MAKKLNSPTGGGVVWAIKALLSLIVLAIPTVITWLIWWPARIWAFSQVPTGAYAGLIKLAIILGFVLIGGITIPIVLFWIAVLLVGFICAI